MRTSGLMRASWAIGVLLVSGVFFGSITPVTTVSAETTAADLSQAGSMQQEDVPGDVSSYWTVERMRDAVPYDVVPAESSSQTLSPFSVQAATTGAPGWSPSRAPDGWGLPVVSGVAGTYPAPTPTLANVTDYVLAADRSRFPYTASGKVFFTMSGVNYVCSGSVIGENTVWTAGHCVNNGSGAFHDNWIFIPAFDNYNDPYGIYAPTYMVMPAEFADYKDISYDYAIVGVQRVDRTSGSTIRQMVGALGFAWNMPRTQDWLLLGYPLPTFGGYEMVYSDSTYYEDNPTFSPASICVGSTMAGGASGGPWILNEKTSTAGQVNYLNGVNSYIFVGANELCSPYLDDRAKQLWDCAQNTANTMGSNCYDSSASANLVLTNTPSSNLVLVNTPYSYTIGLHNTGPAAATNVVLQIRTHSTVNSIVLPGGACSLATWWDADVATCTLSTLASGATVNATLAVTSGSVADAAESSAATVAFDQRGQWAYAVSGNTRTSCAQRITVTNTDDSGPGSLRQALADVCVGGEVDFNPSLSGATIHLASQLVPRSVTIDGSALPKPITISGDTDGDGGGDTRVLYVNDTVTLDTLVIAKGWTNDQGGGIYSRADLTLNNCTLSENSANYGGGLAFESDFVDVIIRNSTFSGNLANYGGGIYGAGDSSLLLANSTLVDNFATYGGGIYASASLDMTLVNDTLSGNTAIDAGGGIYNTFEYSSPATLNYTNTIIANSTRGGDCVIYGGVLGTNSHNLVEDGSCSGALTGDPALGALAANGGPTRTMSLLPTSPALDAGDEAACAASPVDGLDQRGVTRPVGAGCDIGALEYDPIPTVSVSAGSPSNGSVVTGGISSLKVVFNKDVLHDGSPNAADNPVNYLLVEAGENDVFDTQSCLRGLVDDDVQVTVNSVSYISSSQTAILLVNGGEPLPDGQYRLFVCGTTSVMDLNGLKLNAGRSDAHIDFMVAQASQALPATGFAPERVTALPPQTVSYADLGDLWLEIPRLGVEMAIVGIPRSANGEWDVSWLGQDAGWLNGSAFPTWEGNSVLTGHVWNADDAPGPFANLNQLWWGDDVIIHAWGGEYVYEVRSVQQVSPGDVAAMMKHEELSWLTLVTCRGYDEMTGEYNYRVLVRAVLVEVK